jgi:hypothetical protein
MGSGGLGPVPVVWGVAMERPLLGEALKTSVHSRTSDVPAPPAAGPGPAAPGGAVGAAREGPREGQTRAPSCWAGPLPTAVGRHVCVCVCVCVRACDTLCVGGYDTVRVYVWLCVFACTCSSALPRRAPRPKTNLF